MCLLLASCGTNRVTKQPTIATSDPTDIQNEYSTSLYGSEYSGPAATIAVLLPMNGPAKSVGNDIKNSIETAFVRKPQQKISVSFYDISGDKQKRGSTIRSALGTKPDIIIGPLFSEDTVTLRDMKNADTPVISFTSDINALGNNVMTMNLIPTQSIETIVQQMQKDGVKNIIMMAPNDNSGKTMMSVAHNVSRAYNMSVNGVFYYTPNNSDSIKDMSIHASMYNTRNAANTRAREVLSDILNNETLTAETRNDLKRQLEKISRTETLGKLPFDAILFLGNGNDSKTIASFLRYYGVSAHDVSFYGTTLWDTSDIKSDFSLSGAKYATLPPISDQFIQTYNYVSGKDPDYLAAFGYDAANMALGTLYSNKNNNAYLFDPSGYVGTTGIFRIQPNGESERALRIMQLNGTDETKTVREAPNNFLTQIYSINNSDLREIPAKELSTRGINPGDYIKIPENLRKKSAYKTKTIGANYVSDESESVTFEPVQIYASSESETVSNPEFEPVKLESVSRKYIDSVEIAE